MNEIAAPFSLGDALAKQDPQADETWTSPWTSLGCWLAVAPGSESLRGTITTTGIDAVGIETILTRLAGWTSPPVTALAICRPRMFHATWVESTVVDLPPQLSPTTSQELTPTTSREMVQWLHRESGLTWEQLARTLGVSRRSVHAWAAGQRVNGANLERLSNVFATVREIDADSPSARRHVIFTPPAGMPNIFDRLVMLARKAPPPRAEVTVAERLGVASLE